MPSKVLHGPRLTVHQPQHTLCGQRARGWASTGRALHARQAPCLRSSRAQQSLNPSCCRRLTEERVAKALCPPHPQAGHSWDRGQLSEGLSAPRCLTTRGFRGPRARHRGPLLRPSCWVQQSAPHTPHFRILRLPWGRCPHPASGMRSLGHGGERHASGGVWVSPLGPTQDRLPTRTHQQSQWP